MDQVANELRRREEALLDPGARRNRAQLEDLLVRMASDTKIWSVRSSLWTKFPESGVYGFTRAR